MRVAVAGLVMVWRMSSSMVSSGVSVRMRVLLVFAFVVSVRMRVLLVFAFVVSVLAPVCLLPSVVRAADSVSAGFGDVSVSLPHRGVAAPPPVSSLSPSTSDTGLALSPVVTVGQDVPVPLPLPGSSVPESSVPESSVPESSVEMSDPPTVPTSAAPASSTSLASSTSSLVVQVLVPDLAVEGLSVQGSGVGVLPSSSLATVSHPAGTVATVMSVRVDSTIPATGGVSAGVVWWAVGVLVFGVVVSCLARRRKVLPGT